MPAFIRASSAMSGTPPLAAGPALRYSRWGMCPPRSTRKWLHAVALACLTALAFACGARAQEPPPAPGEVEPARPLPQAIAPEDVAARAADAQRSLHALATRAEAAPEVAAVAERIRQVQDGWHQDAEGDLRRLELAPSASFLVETERVWLAREKLLAGWNDTLRRRAGALTEDLSQLDRVREIWEQTLATEREQELPAPLRETIGQVLGAIEETSRSIRERRDAALAIQSSLLQERQRVASVLNTVGAVREQIRSRLFVRDSPALWTRLAYAPSPGVIGRLQSDWKDLLGALESYASEHADDLAAFAFTLGTLVVVIALLGRRAARRTAEDDAVAATARVLGRPVSAALLLLLVAYPLILPTAPLLLRWVATVVVLIPALRLLAPLLDGTARRAFYLLSAWFAVDALRLLLSPAPVLMRTLLLLESAAAVACLVSLLRPGHLIALREEAGHNGSLRAAARFALGLLSISLLSNALGNSSLAELFVQGTLRGAYLAVLLYGSALVLRELWAALLHTRTLRLLRGVQRHEELLRRRGATLFGWSLAFVWLWFTLTFFQLREPVSNVGVALLGATWPFGNVAISLGDLVAFALTVWLALWLSRFIRFVLDEDLLPRAELPRGVPYAISSGVRYVILLLGFLLAIAAAGFDMSRFALIVGALGVGIGIGLQDVVNNFVSGLILLFERPVQTGDAVQVGDIFGEVRRIGMRSSTVRTWGGAEVILPNSRLVSDSVINWTLSDDLRRIEIAIGVAYGTDPERVLALLVDVAHAHPSVLAAPEASALFVAHGNSSLDFELRAWTASGDWIQVKSDLTVAINHALRDAGIAIPFPQHDLHLRSVDPKLRDALRESSGEGSDP